MTGNYELDDPDSRQHEVALLQPIDLPGPEGALPRLIHRQISGAHHHAFGIDPPNLDVQEPARLLDAVEERRGGPDR